MFIFCKNSDGLFRLLTRFGNDVLSASEVFNISLLALATLMFAGVPSVGVC